MTVRPRRVARLAVGRERLRRRAGGEQARGLDELAQVLVDAGQLLRGALEHAERLGGALGPQHRDGERQGGPRAAARAAAHLGRAREMVDRALELLGAQLGGAELEQELALHVGRRALAQRAAQQPGGQLGRPAPARLGGGGAQVGDGLVVVTRLGVEQVQGDALGRRAVVAELARGAGVSLAELALAELRAHGVEHDRVHERQRPAGLEDVRGGERVGGVPRGGRLEVGVGARGGELDALAEHGDRLCQRAARRVEPAQPREDAAADRARADLVHLAGGGGDRQHAGGRELVGQLAQQERVAARGAPAGGHERLLGWHPEAGLDELGDPAAGQRRRRERVDRLVHLQRSEQLSAAAALLRAHGGDHARRDAVQAPEQVQQPAHGRPVGPLQVVDAQQQRPGRRQLDGQPVEAVQRGRRGIGVLERGPGAEQHGLGQRGGAAEQPRALVGARARQDGLEQLARDAEAEAGFELGRARREHAQPGRLAGRARGAQQRRLADAGRPFEEQGVPGAVPGGAAQAFDRHQLPVPLQQAAPWLPIHRGAL
jgi:hypothetical protein